MYHETGIPGWLRESYGLPAFGRGFCRWHFMTKDKERKILEKELEVIKKRIEELEKEEKKNTPESGG